jgi:hypothetical protein
MMDAGSIWESKLSRLQDTNLEKMNLLAELVGELREKRRERAQPRPDTPGPQEGVQQRFWWRRWLGREGR